MLQKGEDSDACALGRADYQTKEAFMSAARLNRDAGTATFRHSKPRTGSEVFSGQTWSRLGRILKLSRRELEIVRGVFNDQTEFAIACNLGISEHTVHTHVERLYRKLDVRDRTQLILRVVREFMHPASAPRNAL